MRSFHVSNIMSITMGKCIKRTLNKSLKSTVLKREEAVCAVLAALKSGNIGSEIRKLLVLFGLTPEELAESGATYEQLEFLKQNCKADF